MAARKDVFLSVLILVFILLSFMVKQKGFLQSDGISLILNADTVCNGNESFASRLFIAVNRTKYK